MRNHILRFIFLFCIILLVQKPSNTEEESTLLEPIIQKHITAKSMEDLVRGTASQSELPTTAAFRNCTFESGAIAMLFKEIPDLESLELSTCRFCESEYQEWETPPSLKELNLSHSYLTDYDLKILTKLEFLETLNLEGVPITGQSLSVLPQPLILKNLNLNRTALSDKGIKSLGRFRNLQDLGIAHTNCSAKAFYMLGIFPELEEVEVNIKFDPHGWFYTLIRQPALKQLPGTDIVNLDLDSWKITDDTLSSINRALPTKILTISHNDLTDACLVSMNQMPNLTELQAVKCNLSGETFSSIPQALKLKKLVLDDNPLTEKGLFEISRLSQLQYLSLRRCLAFTSSKRLESFEQLNVSYLNLSANPITPEDIAFINKMQHLQTLKLDDIPLPEGVFDKLGENNSIKYLTFYNSRGISRHAIEKLAKMQQLRIIHFGGSDVSKKDAAFLSKQIPQIQIDADSLYVH